MSEQSRPLSRWSTSLSIATKSTAATNQTIPLINVRRKLLRQSGNHQKTFAQRMAKTKQDIEELFKLYYSNDIKFDTFQKQIVQGTKIPTARSTAIPKTNLTDSSLNVFNSKHCVSREQISTTDIHSVEQQQQQLIHHEVIPIKSALSKRVVQTQIQSHSPTVYHDSSPSPRISLQPTTTTITKTGSNQQDELFDSSLVKSVGFFEETSPDTSKKSKVDLSQQHPKSSILNIQSIAPQTNIRKDPVVTSHTSISTMASVPTAKTNPPSVVTGSAVTVRPRSSSSKNSWGKQRTKSNLSIRNNSASPQLPTKMSTPTLFSPLTIQPDMSEYPVFIGAQRVVSIPSRCSRYVLVTFPEAPVRYNAPTYVERLLLPERFPNLFQNIVQSYDHHISQSPFQRHTK